MAYDRYERRGPREQSRYSEDRFRDREDRGFFERAGDEIASWFGDEEAERRRRRDEEASWRDPDNGRHFEPSRSSGREREPWGGGGWRDRDEWRDRGYRPMTGDYGRSEGFFAAGGLGRGEEPRGRFDRDRDWSRDEYRRFSFAGTSDRELRDPHYRQWRQRQIEELDRDYDEYRREHQSKFENDFGTWRSNRQAKRQMLGQVREHMEVVGSDDEHVGTVDRVAGDRIILTRSDPESGGVHHSLSCTEIDRIEGDRVILGINANEARVRWRDESRERALFEREDQGEAGPHVLDRSFSGTYR
jgi:hypothetical protein